MIKGYFKTGLFVLAIVSVLFVGQSEEVFAIIKIEKDKVLAYIPSLPIFQRFSSPFLINYPFMAADNIKIAEGYSEYDGNLLDQKGELHWGIDYIKKENNEYKKFKVFSAHSGTAVQGYGKTWGKFVVVRFRDKNNNGFNTLYAHLDGISKNIPYYSKDFNNDFGVSVSNGTYLGMASNTGNTKGINQLHFELQIVGKGYSYRLDPYGVYDRLSSGHYPDPGRSLIGLRHFWNKDFPDFAY